MSSVIFPLSRLFQILRIHFVQFLSPPLRIAAGKVNRQQHCRWNIARNKHTDQRTGRLPQIPRMRHIQHHNKRITKRDDWQYSSRPFVFPAGKKNLQNHHGHQNSRTPTSANVMILIPIPPCAVSCIRGSKALPYPHPFCHLPSGV